MNQPENLFKHWWWIVLCMLLFAGIANLALELLPARYEQAADLQILFEPTEQINWTDKDMLAFTETVGWMIEDPALQQAVLQGMKEYSYSINPEELSKLLSKERRFYGWELTISSRDAKLTETLLAVWQTVLQEAIERDLAASQQAQLQFALATAWIPCLQQLPAEPVHPLCNPANITAIAPLYQTDMAAYQASKTSVRYLTGFPANVAIEIFSAEAVTKVPLFSRAILLLSGGIVGAAVGFFTIQQPWICQIRTNKKR